MAPTSQWKWWYFNKLTKLLLVGLNKSSGLRKSVLSPVCYPLSFDISLVLGIFRICCS